MSTSSTYIEQFSDLDSHLPIQKVAKAHLKKGLSFPTTREEYWRYTRIQPILDQRVAFNVPTVSSVSDYKIPGLDAYFVVLVNGLLQPQLSDQVLAKGAVVCSFSDASPDQQAIIDQHLGKYAAKNPQAFGVLNTAYFQDGLLISIADNTELDKPICVVHIADGMHQTSQVRQLIHLGRNAKAQVVNIYAGKDDLMTFTNAATEMMLGEGSSGSICLIQREGIGSKQVNSIDVGQARDSQATIVTLTQTGDLVRNNLNFHVAGEGCTSNMYGVYFTSGKQHVDNHTYIDHMAPNCNSNELYKGVMADKSTGVFNGKIMVQREAQKTNAFQSNQNILLSDQATINTKPELEIYADDVKCSHGCTIGQLDEEALFYLQSRGLSKAMATNLLVQAFAGEVTEKIENEAVRGYAEDFIHSKFEHLHA